MKKLLLTTMIAALLLVPFHGVALAENQEAALSGASTSQEEGFIPGGVPAQTGAVESMPPAIHAVILASLNHELTSFDPADTQLAWEALYNMLSMYGQMDERSDYLHEQLVLPVETVMDFAAALFPDFSALGELPGELSDRIVFDQEIDGYLVTCGNDSLAEIQFSSTRERADGALELTGSLVYLVDDSILAQFQATLLPRDNMFGYTLVSLELTA